MGFYGPNMGNSKGCTLAPAIQPWLDKSAPAPKIYIAVATPPFATQAGFQA
jgi:hypothetical protein